MELPVIGNVFRCTVNQQLASFPMANVFHVFNSSSPSPDDVALAVAGSWAGTNSLTSVQSTGVAYLSVDVIPLDGATGSASVDFSTAPHQGGQHAGEPVPPQVAATISVSTNGRGRSRRGRMYVGGIPLSYIDEDTLQWDLSSYGEILGAFDTFVGLLQDADPNLFFGVASYLHASFATATSWTLSPQTGTQRLRARA